MSDEDEWYLLRLAFLRERVDFKGAEADYVTLARHLFEIYVTSGNAEYLAEASAEVRQARSRYPNSVPLWEHAALFDSVTGDEQDLAHSLDVLTRLAPDSPVISAASRSASDSGVAWDEQAKQTAVQLWQEAGSPDAAVSAAAITGLERWTRWYPRNSTYTINLSFGLIAAGRKEEARLVASSAAQIEDGSWEDAYNLGVIFAATSDPAEARRFLSEALARNPASEAMALVQEALGKLPE